MPPLMLVVPDKLSRLKLLLPMLSLLELLLLLLLLVSMLSHLGMELMVVVNLRLVNLARPKSGSMHASRPSVSLGRHTPVFRT